jgi:hypothetical protein
MTERRSQRVNAINQSIAIAHEPRNKRQQNSITTSSSDNAEESIQQDQVNDQIESEEFNIPTLTSQDQQETTQPVDPIQPPQQPIKIADNWSFEDIFNDSNDLNRDMTRSISENICAASENIMIHRRLRPLTFEQCRSQLGIHEDTEEALIAKQLCIISEKIVASCKLMGPCENSFNLIDANEDLKTIAIALSVPFNSRKSFMTKHGEEANLFDTKALQDATAIKQKQQQQQQFTRRRPYRSYRSNYRSSTFTPINRSQPFRGNTQSSQNYQSQPKTSFSNQSL